jgi:hypothetical protein
MSNLPDVHANASHEELVRAFMASVPKRKRLRVQTKYPVLSEHDSREIRHEETLWDPQLLDSLETSEGPVIRSALKAKPSNHGKVVVQRLPIRSIRS